MYRWFLLLIIPFIVGMIIHFVVPLEFLEESYPRAQDVYNIYKRQSQQNSVRTLAILNARILRNKIQTYEQMRSLLIKIFHGDSIYERIQTNKINLNYAGSMNNQSDTKKSMWFAPGITNLSQLNQFQNQIYNLYLKVEPFVRSILTTNCSRNMPQLQVILNYSNSPLLFKYPSQIDPQYQNPNAIIYSSIYNETMQNWYNDHREYKISVKNQTMYSCNVMFDNDDNPVGTVCLKINLFSIASELTSLGVPTYNYSTNIYYLLTPIYKNNDSPRILFNFSDSNLSNVEYPTKSYIQIPSTIDRSMWYPNSSYVFYTKQIQPNRAYFQVPISIQDYNKNTNTILFLLTENIFKKVSFQYQIKNAQTLKTILVPSIILIIVSVILSVVVLRCLLSDLQHALRKLFGCCQHILNDNLDVNIPVYDKTEDLRELYALFGTINELYKVSSQNFFTGPHEQRLLKYLAVEQMFGKHLKYDTSNVAQIIGNCYFNIKNYKNAAQFYEQSINGTLEQIKKEFNDVDLFLADTKNKKKNSKWGIIRKKFIQKLFKLIICLIWTLNPPDRSLRLENVFNQFELAVKHSFELSSQYISILLMKARYNLTIGKIQDFIHYIKLGQQALNKFRNSGCIQQLSSNQLDIPLELLKSYYHFMESIKQSILGNTAQAFKLMILSLQENIFSPEINIRASKRLSDFLAKANLLTPELTNTCYLTQISQIKDKEYVFLFDWSRSPKTEVQIIKKWRKEALAKATMILNEFLESQDRLSIIRFCEWLQIECNLLKKDKNEFILQKQIENLKKQKSIKRPPKLKRAMQQAIDRISDLQNMKIVIVFLKPETLINEFQIVPILKRVPKLKVIFLQNETKAKPNPFYFIFDYNKDEDFERVLLHKKTTNFGNQISPF